MCQHLLKGPKQPAVYRQKLQNRQDTAFTIIDGKTHPSWHFRHARSRNRISSLRMPRFLKERERKKTAVRPPDTLAHTAAIGYNPYLNNYSPQ